jgi:tRNA G18 (ribose-2'-O)-methylase SpoU
MGGSVTIPLVETTEWPAALADVRATIAMAPGVDSLNVVVACGIALDRLATSR